MGGPPHGDDWIALVGFAVFFLVLAVSAYQGERDGATWARLAPDVNARA